MLTFIETLLPFQGAIAVANLPRAIALGYVLAGPSARSLNACQLQVNT